MTGCFLREETLYLWAPRIQPLLVVLPRLPPLVPHLPPNIQRLTSLCCLHSPWLVSPGWSCGFKSQPCPPSSLSSPSSLLSTSCAYPQAYVSSPLAHLTDLSKTELLIFMTKITSPSALTPILLTPHPSHQQILSALPDTHPEPAAALASSALASSCSHPGLKLSQQPHNGTNQMLSVPCHKQPRQRESSPDSSKPACCSALTFHHNPPSPCWPDSGPLSMVLISLTAFPRLSYSSVPMGPPLPSLGTRGQMPHAPQSLPFVRVFIPT